MAWSFFRLEIDLAPRADDALDLADRAAKCNRQELLFVLGCRHAGDGTNLGVGDLALAQRLADTGKIRQGAGHANFLASRAGIEADAPRQPVSAGLAALLRPAAFLIELANQHQQPVIGGLELGRQSRDLLGELVITDLLLAEGGLSHRL